MKNNFYEYATSDITLHNPVDHSLIRKRPASPIWIWGGQCAMFSPELERQEDGMGREGRDYWEAQLSEYWDSGLTIQEYSELKELPYESTRRWSL